MKATKATNIQIRLFVEESQQLNSKKKKDKKEREIVSKWNNTDSKLYTKYKRKSAMKWIKRKTTRRNGWIFLLLFITRIAL